jgi:hypothetical protein
MDASPVGGFEVLFFINVLRLRFAFASGAPLTVTLGLSLWPLIFFEEKEMKQLV